LKLVTLLSSSKPFDISFVLLWTIYKGFFVRKLVYFKESPLMWLGVAVGVGRFVEVLVGVYG